MIFQFEPSTLALGLEWEGNKVQRGNEEFNSREHENASCKNNCLSSSTQSNPSNPTNRIPSFMVIIIIKMISRRIQFYLISFDIHHKLSLGKEIDDYLLLILAQKST